MARPRTSSIFKKGKTWYLHFFPYLSDKRKKSSLKTQDENLAAIKLNEIKRLASFGVTALEAEAQDVDALVFSLYYGREKKLSLTKDETPINSAPDSGDVDDNLDYILRLHKIIELQEIELKELRQVKAAHEALLKKREIKEIQNAENCPGFNLLIGEYEPYIFSKVSAHTARKYLTYIENLRDFKENKHKKPSELSWHDIDDFLTDDAQKAAPGVSLNNRKVKTRALLSRFFKWLEKRYNIENPINKIESIQKEALEITWYDVPQVEAVLNSCGSYWAGILATLAYSGIGSKELSGIKTVDFEAIDGEHFLFVQSNKHRGTKRENRRRSVHVDNRYLLPRIEQFINDGHAGKEILFALPKGRAITRDIKTTNPEIWIPDEIGRYANREILKTHNMKVKYLRNTAGSLMLRSGYSVEEVAAVLGNTPEVVRKHYARLISSEITKDLKHIKKGDKTTKKGTKRA